MPEQSKTAFLYSPHFLDHNAEIEHLESPERLTAILSVLESGGIRKRLKDVSPRPAKRREVLSVHNEAYLSFLSRLGQRGGGYLDPDTYVSPCSEEVAYLAAGAVITAVDEVFAGQARNAFCLVRPPGHHATSNQGVGFCLLDNLAIGAKYAQGNKGVSRIMIVDWDAHHGNGLQDTFFADQNVLYVSLHQFPHYPGTGHQSEVGTGPGRGFTVNIPFPARTGGEAFRLAFEEIVLPIGEKFKPELILIAAGYDGHFADPLSGLRLSVSDFSTMTGYLCRLADSSAKGRLIASLEGGYNLESLSLSVAQTIINLAGIDISLAEPFQDPLSGSPVLEASRDLLEQVKEIQRHFWRL